MFLNFYFCIKNLRHIILTSRCFSFLTRIRICRGWMYDYNWNLV